MKPKSTSGFAGLAIAGVILVALLAFAGGLAAWLWFDSANPHPGNSDENIQTLSPRQKKINAAVGRGADYLKQQILQPGNNSYYFHDPGAGSNVGVVALAGLTLLECGAGTSEAAVRKAADVVRQAAPNLRFTYSIALSILFLDRLNDPKEGSPSQSDIAMLHQLAARLAASQNEIGGWDYYCHLLDSAEEARVVRALKLGDGLSPIASRKDDNSINQFCTLALWAARRHQLKTDTALAMIDKRYREQQEPDGSWRYHAAANQDLKAATTCAGLIGLAVGQAVKIDALSKDAKAAPGNFVKDDPKVAKALAYVGGALKERQNRVPATEDRQRRQKHTKDLMDLYRQWHEGDEETRPGIARQIGNLDDSKLLKGTLIGADAWGDLYFLWSVERVGVMFDLPSLGGIDWFQFGSDVILKHQETDGSWKDRFPGIPDTCFALLFLRRANLIKDVTDKLRLLLRSPGVSALPHPRERQPASIPPSPRDS